MRFIYMMMRGDSRLERVRVPKTVAFDTSSTRPLSLVEGSPTTEEAIAKNGTFEAFGLEITKEEGENGEIT